MMFTLNPLKAQLGVSSVWHITLNLYQLTPEVISFQSVVVLYPPLPLCLHEWF